MHPVSPDERPTPGELTDALWVASGDGSEGVTLGAGSAEHVSQMLGEAPSIDPAPFDPARSW